MSFIPFPIHVATDTAERFGKMLAVSRDEVDAIASRRPVTWDSFITPLSEIDERINVFFTPVSHLNSTKNSPEIREIHESCLRLVTEYSTALSQHEGLAEATRILSDDCSLDSTRRKVLRDMLLDFRLGGVGLPEKQKNRMREINLRLSELGNRFSQNLLDATNAFELIVQNEEDVAGMPESDKAAAKRGDEYRFTLQMPSYLAFMTYSPNRELRETMYRAYVTRAPENGTLIPEMLALRAEKAKILGYESYDALSIERKAAPTPQAVTAFLSKLAEAAKPQAEREFASLTAFAAKKGIDNLAAWDIPYVSEMMKKELYDYDEEQYRPYLEKQRVTDGMFMFFEKLFGITFAPVETPVWDTTVTAYDVMESGVTVARLYMDLEARSDKRGGAWMNNWQTRFTLQNGSLMLPSAFVVGNFPPQSADAPSLLRPSDVTTLFHEMGHALHHLLTRVDIHGASGINGVQWDAIEYPSQMLENFAEEPQVLAMFARHWQTGETIPVAFAEKIRDTKNYLSAMGMVRQLEFGLFDMLIHEAAYTEEEVHGILQQVRERVSVVPVPEYNRFQNSFSHIFAGSYAAGYYSYKWAELMSADTFFRIMDDGIFGDVAKRYREVVLGGGGSKSMTDLYREFAGAEPDIQALLKLSGIR